MTWYLKREFRVNAYSVVAGARIGKPIDKKVKVMPATVQKCCSKVMRARKFFDNLYSFMAKNAYGEVKKKREERGAENQ